MSGALPPFICLCRFLVHYKCYVNLVDVRSAVLCSIATSNLQYFDVRYAELCRNVISDLQKFNVRYAMLCITVITKLQ